MFCETPLVGLDLAALLLRNLTAWKMYFIQADEFICFEVYPNTHVLSKNEKGEVDCLILKNFGTETKVRRAGE